MMMKHYKKLIFKRKGVVVEPSIEEGWGSDNSGIRFTIPGEYRDCVVIWLDEIKLFSSSSLRTVCISKRGVF